MSENDMSGAVLERAWAVLEPPRGKQLAAFRLDVSFGGVACRVALDSTGSRHVLIPVTGEVVSPDRRPSTLDVAVRQLAFGGDSATYLDLSCSERDLFAEFDEVAQDVLEAARGAERPAAAAVRAVDRWRRLFRSRLVRGLSYQARLGLFAELTMLSALLDNSPTFPVERWRGPLREPHDFEAPARCLEVKALGPDADTVTIHGIDQLDTHDGRLLDLVLVRVVEDVDGVTVTDLVRRIRDRVTSRTDLRDRLTAAGWVASQTSDTEAFVVADVMCVPVGGDVPRLSSRSLVDGAAADGITDLRYSVDVAALLPFASGASVARIAGEACC